MLFTEFLHTRRKTSCSENKGSNTASAYVFVVKKRKCRQKVTFLMFIHLFFFIILVQGEGRWRKWQKCGTAHTKGSRRGSCLKVSLTGLKYIYIYIYLFIYIYIFFFFFFNGAKQADNALKQWDKVIEVWALCDFSGQHNWTWIGMCSIIYKSTMQHIPRINSWVILPGRMQCLWSHE